MEFRKILVLGNSGFIGKNLERYLVNKFSGIQVIGYSTKDIDLTNGKDTQKLTKDFDLDTAVVMCSMVKKQSGDNIDSYFKNLQMAVNLTRVLEQNPVKRFVYVSSAAVYGEEVHNINITEQTLPTPTSYYGMAKCASEHLFLKACVSFSQNSILVLRPPAIYGAGERRVSYDPAGFINKAIDQEPVVLWGDGSELREFVYIDDLISVVSKLLFSDFAGIVNVVSGKSYCFTDILSYIKKFLNREFLVEERPRTKKKVDNCFKNDLIRSLLPDFRFTSLEEGTRKVIEERLSLVK